MHASKTCNDSIIIIIVHCYNGHGRYPARLSLNLSSFITGPSKDAWWRYLFLKDPAANSVRSAANDIGDIEHGANWYPMVKQANQLHRQLDHSLAPVMDRNVDLGQSPH